MFLHANTFETIAVLGCYCYHVFLERLLMKPLFQQCLDSKRVLLLHQQMMIHSSSLLTFHPALRKEKLCLIMCYESFIQFLQRYGSFRQFIFLYIFAQKEWQWYTNFVHIHYMASVFCAWHTFPYTLYS